MRIVIVNGSPKGEYSITLQTVNYLSRRYPEHTFELLHAGQRIKALEKDFSAAKQELAWAQLLIFSYPVYTFLAPCQLHRFLELVKESGRSSWVYLQNVTPAGYKEHQDMALALALCERYLKGRGASRVHGGGFAGTVQAFVPFDLLEEFRAGIDAVLGEGACHVLSIRPQGGVEAFAE